LQRDQLWEWTKSDYLAQARINKLSAALGEYNGKFVINQMISRVAVVATEKEIIEKHIAQLFVTINARVIKRTAII